MSGILRHVAIIAVALCVATRDASATTAGAPRSHTDSIIVHAISGPLQDCPRGRLEFSGAPGDAKRWKAFFDRHPFLGIHYVIDRDGRVEASTQEGRRANHALGASDTAIGIELVHNGDGVEPFGPLQRDALIVLIKQIRTRFAVPVENIKGHADVDTRTFTCGGRVYKGRMDPGENFPWEAVRTALRGDPKLIAAPRLVSRGPTTVRR